MRTEVSMNENGMTGLELIKQNDCITCHSFTEKLVAPSFGDIAGRYAATQENVTTLSKKIIKGGGGSWSELPMTPHPTLSEQDAEIIMKYIFSFKNNQ